MQIGPVYRLQVTDIPNNEGLEIFPTVEVIDRLYPPPGLALRFPIPIELTQDELELAARGAFVTRVIYVEDPHQALPIARQGQRRAAVVRSAGGRRSAGGGRPRKAGRSRFCGSAAGCRVRSIQERRLCTGVQCDPAAVRCRARQV